MIPGETIRSGANHPDDVTEFMVMRSAAGYYIGTAEVATGFPYSRESHYYPTHEAAQKALDTDQVNWR